MDNSNKKTNNKVDMSKFNLNWMCMVIAPILLGLHFANGNGSVNRSISYDEF